jgi:AcrR family transcriptional regulator
MDEAGLTRGHKKKARTRRQLLDAAARVVATRGEAFSITDVASEAGVSNGTFYNYFEDREVLVDAMIEDLLTDMASDLAEVVTEDDPAQRFATTTALAIHRAVLAPAAMKAMLRVDALHRAVEGDGPLRHLRNDLAKGAASGQFRIVDAEAATDVVTGTMIRASRRVIEDGPDARRERAVVEHLLLALGVESEKAQVLAARAFEVVADFEATTEQAWKPRSGDGPVG